MRCARQGCNRTAKGDEFCSSHCARTHHAVKISVDTNDDQRLAQLKRRLERGEIKRSTYQTYRNRILKEREDPPVTVTIENTDAMSRRVPGSYGSNSR